jgi:hypothetical protein
VGKVRMTIHEDGVDDLLDAPAVLSVVSGGALAVATAASVIAPDGGAGRGLKESYKATKATREEDRVVATAFTDDIAGHLEDLTPLLNGLSTVSRDFH